MKKDNNNDNKKKKLKLNKKNILILITIACAIVIIVTIALFFANRNTNPVVEPPVITENSEDNALTEENKQILSLVQEDKKINSDVVGWIRVPGTKIDYSVVKTTNNTYYLNHNLKKQADSNGWIFMGKYYDAVNLGRNTVLFGHNKYTTGKMFGTLQNLSKKEWLDNIKTNLITFSTETDVYRWEVFSIYAINDTSDYLKNLFSGDDDFFNYINMIRGRSEIKSDIEIKATDKVLTLSTCLDGDRRYAVHAVLRDDLG